MFLFQKAGCHTIYSGILLLVLAFWLPFILVILHKNSLQNSFCSEYLLEARQSICDLAAQKFSAPHDASLANSSVRKPSSVHITATHRSCFNSTEATEGRRLRNSLLAAMPAVRDGNVIDYSEACSIMSNYEWDTIIFAVVNPTNIDSDWHTFRHFVGWHLFSTRNLTASELNTAMQRVFCPEDVPDIFAVSSLYHGMYWGAAVAAHSIDPQTLQSIVPRFRGHSLGHGAAFSAYAYFSRTTLPVYALYELGRLNFTSHMLAAAEAVCVGLPDCYDGLYHSFALYARTSSIEPWTWPCTEASNTYACVRRRLQHVWEYMGADVQEDIFVRMPEGCLSMAPRQLASCVEAFSYVAFNSFEHARLTQDSDSCFYLPPYQFGPVRTAGFLLQGTSANNSFAFCERYSTAALQCACTRGAVRATGEIDANAERRQQHEFDCRGFCSGV